MTASDDTIRRAADGPQVNAVLHVVLLQLGQDVLAVGVLAQSGDVGPDLGRSTAWVTPAAGRPPAPAALPGPKRARKATPSPLRSKPHRWTATGTELSAGGGRSSYAGQGHESSGGGWPQTTSRSGRGTRATCLTTTLHGTAASEACFQPC